jgi:hypothetical protein
MGWLWLWNRGWYSHVLQRFGSDWCDGWKVCGGGIQTAWPWNRVDERGKAFFLPISVCQVKNVIGSNARGWVRVGIGWAFGTMGAGRVFVVIIEIREISASKDSRPRERARGKLIRVFAVCHRILCDHLFSCHGIGQ